MPRPKIEVKEPLPFSVILNRAFTSGISGYGAMFIQVSSLMWM